MSINLKLNLSDAQKRKLQSGGTVQVRNNQIGSGHDFKLHKENAKKIIKALKNGSGVRLGLSDHEIEGSGIFGKKADRWFKKVGIDKAVNKVGNALKPLAHEAITAVGRAGSAYGLPTAKVEQFAHDYINDPTKQQALIRDKYNEIKSGNYSSIGNALVTDGTGIRRIRGKGFNKYMPIRGQGFRSGEPPQRITGSGTKHARTHIRDDQSNFIQSDNANFYPSTPQTYKDIQHGIQKIKGGSFIAH